MRTNSTRGGIDRIGNGIARGVHMSADDTQLLQELTHGLFSDEAQQTIEHAHQYGFTSVAQPPTGEGDDQMAAEPFIAYIEGNRSHGVAFTIADRRYRLYKLQNGEVALHDDQGHQIHLARDGIYVSAPNSKKIVGQIMADDALPQDGKNGQIQQKGRSSVGSYQIDKEGFTANHDTQSQLTVGQLVVRVTTNQVILGNPTKPIFPVVTTGGPSMVVLASLEP